MESKKCTSCLKVKSLDNYHKRSLSEDGLNYACKSCCSSGNKSKRGKILTGVIRTCTACKKEKDSSLFMKKSRNKDGIDNRCKKCVKDKVYFKEPNNTKEKREINIKNGGNKKCLAKIEKAKRKSSYKKSPNKRDPLKNYKVCPSCGLTKFYSNYLLGKIKENPNCKDCKELRRQKKNKKPDYLKQRLNLFKSNVSDSDIRKYKIHFENYKSYEHKILVECYEHNIEFLQSPASIKNNGVICKECKKDERFNFTKNRLFEVHGSRYTYIDEELRERPKKINITCDSHGIFLQDLGNHLAGSNCPKCMIEDNVERLTENTESFIAKSIRKYGKKFTYEKTIYTGNKDDVIITCVKHGCFNINANSHINGVNGGCMACKSEGAEKRLRKKPKHLDEIAKKYRAVSKNTIFKRDPKTYDRLEKMLGCRMDFLKSHLESQFENWMSWDNHGHCKSYDYRCTWHIDHIVPISSAENEEDLYNLNHWSNLQPLCSRVNMIDKKDKLPQLTNLENKEINKIINKKTNEKFKFTQER